MPVDLNREPYYDDYNPDKGFYKILFKPGKAVQARELTQLQTNLQEQIRRFGDNIFKEGSVVLSGQQIVDFYYKYVKLTSESAGIAPSMVGKNIIGETSGIRATVVNYLNPENLDPPTLYVKYLSSANDNITKTFFDGETILAEDDLSIVRVANLDATGNGTAFSIASGVLYVKEHFVHYENQTIVVEKYIGGENANINKAVGFVATESFVDENDDESLLDTALGSSNYYAPGADRYSIILNLSVKNFDQVDDDLEFIEMIRIENGVIIRENLNPEYSVIGDTLARRTFDQSGNFTVKPYGIDIIEHLNSEETSVRNGYLTFDNGGNAELFVSVISPGKSYVLGYEHENIKSRFVEATKARDFIEVNNGSIDNVVGNYVLIDNTFSIPDLITLNRVSLYNKYTEVNGNTSGDLVGSARIRSISLHSGTQYKAYLFDIKMNAGFTFEKHAKQIFYNNSGFLNFTANISAIFKQLTGSVVTENASNVISGIGTRFIGELEDGDYVTINGNTILIDQVINDITLITDEPVDGDLTGVAGFVNRTRVINSERTSYIFELPFKTIKTIDPTNSETNYSITRIYDVSLSGGNASINAGVNEVFAPYTNLNYVAVNLIDGSYINLDGKVSRSGSPIGQTISFELGLASEDVRFITTIQKSNSSSLRKNKILVEDFDVNLSTNTTARASVISLTRADVYKINSIRMSTKDFDTAYNDDDAIDITNRYDFDNGQRLTHYDIASISLKQGYAKPTGPVRINFDYFNHTGGDYFSVDSYNDIGYSNIPSFNSGNKVFNLRDCLDFRPRIDNNGLTFTNHSGFPDQSTDFFTDYEYYLPRTDKIVIDSTGNFKYVEGKSSLRPVEPATPQNTMALFVLKQNAFVFNVKNDIAIVRIDNKRYTMRDIGRIEDRIKNLEYYTTLSLLERETSVFQIKDNLGFDRFKNGFIVDNFSGHIIGDTLNPDYKIAMDFNNGFIRPMYEQKFLSLHEVNENDSERTADHYQRTGNIATLPYTDVVFVENNAASRLENINPFSVVNWIGALELDPPSDIWFDENRLPTLYQNQEGNFNTVTSDAISAGTYGTIWGAWTTSWYGDTRTDSREGTKYTVNESIVTTTDNDVVINRDVIPTMRSIIITFSAFGLKPNTKMFAFFNDLSVSDFCSGNQEPVNVELGGENFILNQGNIITNIDGFVSGTFSYDSEYFNFPTGENFFRLTDSPTNGNDSETSAEAIFKSSGELVTLRNEVTSTRNGYLTSETVYESQSQTIISEPAPPNEPTFIDGIVQYAVGYTPWQQAADSWRPYMLDVKIAADNTPNAERTIIESFMNPNGSLNSLALVNAVNAGTYVPSLIVKNAYSSIRRVISECIHIYYKTARVGSGGHHNFTNVVPGDLEAAISITAVDMAYGFIVRDSSLPNTTWKTYRRRVLDNPFRATSTLYAVATYGSFVPRSSWDIDPLAQTFILTGNPIFLTKVDVYFQSKDNNVPAFLEIRTVENGNPTQKVVPFSRKLIKPEDVSLSDDASVPTTIKFDGLVYLEPGEYAITLLTNSIHYRVWISQVGEKDIVTNKFISTQPFVGVLFKSQNASTWTADQLQDLKFKLYRAEFDVSLRGTIDLVVDPYAYQRKFLEFDPLEVYPGSTTMKVYHNNNGMVEGSTVLINGFTSEEVSIEAKGNIFGVDITTLDNVEYNISNVKQNFYTVDLPTIANVDFLTRGGDNGIVVTQDLRYDALHPAISALEVSGTTINYQILSTDVGYIFRPFTPVNKGTIEFSESKVLPSDVNRIANLGSTDAFVFRIILQSDSKLTSPLIDMQQLGSVFIRNLVNNPSYETENIGPDVVLIAENNDISFTQVTNTTGYINIVDNVDKANVSGILKGTSINIFGSGDNDGRFRVIEIVDSGSNILVAGEIFDETAGNTITITNGISFVAEEASQNGSALSKYITKQFDFINPSSSINIRLDVNKPEGTFVKFYYKTKLINEDINLADKDFIEIENVEIRTALSDEFYEIETQIDDLPQFNALVLKIVLLSDNSAKVPKASALRVIALA
jgi:hypothetical protein